MVHSACDSFFSILFVCYSGWLLFSRARLIYWLTDTIGQYCLIKIISVYINFQVMGEIFLSKICIGIDLKNPRSIGPKWFPPVMVAFVMNHMTESQQSILDSLSSKAFVPLHSNDRYTVVVYRMTTFEHCLLLNICCLTNQMCSGGECRTVRL